MKCCENVLNKEVFVKLMISDQGLRFTFGIKIHVLSNFNLIFNYQAILNLLINNGL